MLEVIKTIILCIIQVISCTYVAKAIINKSLNIKERKNIIILIMLVITFYIFMNYDIGVYKPIIIYIVLTLGYKYIFRITYNESSVVNLISMLLNGFVEAIVSVIIILAKVPESFIKTYLANTPLSNLIIFGVIYILVKLLRKYLIKLKLVLENEKITYGFYIILSIGVTLLVSKNINNWRFNSEFIINTVILIIFILIIFFLFKEKLTIQRSREENQKIINQANGVKTLLEKHQKHNHETNNQLMIIREKAKGNKEIVEYIDAILKDEIGHENKWISELRYINDTGISGFISLKINKMIDEKMNVKLTISPKVKKFKFNKMKARNLNKMSKVLGVYIDNAYEASKETKKKEVTVEVLMDEEKLLIIISNSYKGKIDLEKIDEHGYTTKGKEHGVGLSLASDIIESNSFLEQKREIIKDYYFQYLYVGLK